MSQQIENLLNRLDLLKPTGSSRWMSRCPAHEDRTPSLSIRETDDGRILLHCFAGCETESILDAVALEFSDLFPDRRTDTFLKPLQIRISDREALRLLEHEMWAIAVLAEQPCENEGFTHIAIDRLRLAGRRIKDVLSAIPAR